MPDFENWVNIKTEIHMAIDREFRKAGITIAFPQRDIHFDTDSPLQVYINSEKQEAAKARRKKESGADTNDDS